MSRRSFIAGLFGATMVGIAWAQPRDAMRRLGVLLPLLESDTTMRPLLAALLQGLGELNWHEGDNLRVDWRWGGGDPTLYERYAAELVALEPDVLLASSSPAVAALRRRTDKIPIVFIFVTDPVGQGFATSLASPGGNITGFSDYDPAMAEIEAIGARLASEVSGGLLILPDSFTVVHRDTIVAIAAEHRLSAVYPFRYFATIGGLMSYGIDQVDPYRRSASYIDRILKGAKASELPIQNPIKFDLVINLKSAKALGVAIPHSMLASADEVIE